MADSRNQPELENLGFNSAVIKPEMRANKAEDAGQTLTCPLKAPLKPDQQPICGDKCLEQPRPTIAELEEIIKRDGSGAIEIMPNGEIKVRERNGVNLEELNIHTVPNGRGGHKLVAGKSPESPNQQIITEIEGLMSQVDEKLGEIIITDEISGDSARKWRLIRAIGEIDLFQNITLRELKKAFE